MLKQGQKVIIDYCCSLDDGSICDSSEMQGKPLEFIYGSAQTQMLPAVFRAVNDMQIGETRNFVIPSVEAYGVYDETLVNAAPLASFPNADQLPVGSYIVVSTASGNARVKVVQVTDDQVILDFNHELAGQDLHYTITLVDLPGLTGSLIERERYLTGSCACGCDEMRHSLQHDHNGGPSGHNHGHDHNHNHDHEPSHA